MAYNGQSRQPMRGYLIGTGVLAAIVALAVVTMFMLRDAKSIGPFERGNPAGPAVSGPNSSVPAAPVTATPTIR